MFIDLCVILKAVIVTLIKDKFGKMCRTLSWELNWIGKKGCVLCESERVGLVLLG